MSAFDQSSQTQQPTNPASYSKLTNKSRLQLAKSKHSTKVRNVIMIYDYCNLKLINPFSIWIKNNNVTLIINCWIFTIVMFLTTINFQNFEYTQNCILELSQLYHCMKLDMTNCALHFLAYYKYTDKQLWCFRKGKKWFNKAFRNVGSRNPQKN